jgi:two-component system, sensor histidine kinase
VRSAELFALRADGSEFPAGIRLAPIRIHGKLLVAAAIRDNTERTFVNEELLTARKGAERANRAKSRFLATASHDLRQPMQTIRLLNAALLKIVPEEELRDLLHQQGQAIQNMTRLLNALLDISRLESGAVEPVSVDVRLAEVFQELGSEFASLARARDIDLQVRPTSMVLSTDRTLLYQLLQNVLGNALKYTDRGWVRLEAWEGPDGITVAVEDSGIGIPADKLQRIFDEYYQVDTHGTKRTGVGLGLAIVREVTRLLGFSVKILSRIGEGTQVLLRIPDRYRLATAMPIAAPVAPGPAAQSRRTRVLLVEDNDGVRLATELFLKLEGYEAARLRRRPQPRSCWNGCNPATWSSPTIIWMARPLASI